MAALVLLLVLAGLVLLWLARRLRVRSGLPDGWLVATDTGAGRPLNRPLFARRYSLTGRPDYIVADGADRIPVEVKSARAPAHPYPAHVLQVAAYCLLIAETFQRRPPYGILRYADRTFRIPYTRELEKQLLSVLEAMRADLTNGDAPRRHQDPRRCAVCGYREMCDEALS
ncbi:MAG: CRISPR-associated protein Cas4 [Anaerolineae bacterium]|nr:CRISPR-associated protein Cas4 [Anaerolineae bacterium]MDW8067452.1 CRISPR-associated protein Cas4 [Anaerolineae bacterium]